MNLRGGILIIGSLLWDDHQGDNKNFRKNWRSKRLLMNERIHVKAPIRYGRRSGSGRNLTMVFSKECEIESKLGTAYLIPLRNREIKSFKGIENQARFLSEAEGSNDKKLKKGNQNEWCTIGILFNPKMDTKKREKLLEDWKSKLKEDGGLKNINIYNSILTEDGELSINWLRSVNKNEQNIIDNFDFILATCTVPTENPYPNEKTISEDIIMDNRRYFYNNIKRGILTFQDMEIIKK